MADELVFYTNPMSRGRVVRWMLEEVGQPYRTELLEYGTTMKAPEYLRINPMGKVPALRHGDTVVTECAAICAYLADAFPGAGLAPAPRDRLRGPYYRWLLFAAGPLEAAATNKAFGFEVPAERGGMAGYGSLADVLAVFEAALAEREYLVGERFTAADLYVGSHLGWGMRFGTVDARPTFERYFERLSARPAAIRARGIDDALVAERTPPTPG
jgi:glutathione S-transferase